MMCRLNENGVLTITATEPIESYALDAWEKSGKSYKSRLVIEKECSMSLEDIAMELKKEKDKLKKWRIENNPGKELEI